MCAAGTAGAEITLVNDSLQQWEISLFDWAFDEECILAKDLRALSEERDDLVVRERDSNPRALPLMG